MLTIFNRKEVYTTFSMSDQAKARDALHGAGIGYYVKVVNRNSPGAINSNRARIGTFGQNMDVVNQYIIYVHKKDYAAARGLLRK